MPRQSEFGKRLFTNFTHNAFELQEILNLVKEMLIKTSPDYDIVLERLHLYHDMKLVSFGIDINRNLIIQFPVFVQPYTQQLLTLYQLDTVPVPIVKKNTKADSYTQGMIKKPYLSLNTETYINVRQQELATCKRIGYNFFLSGTLCSKTQIYLKL